MSESARLKLRDVREIFRIVGEVRELGADPMKWRPHMLRRLRALLGAELVISSEVHVRKTADGCEIVDLGWGATSDGEEWQIRSVSTNDTPETYHLIVGTTRAAATPGRPVRKPPKLTERSGGDKTGAVDSTAHGSDPAPAGKSAGDAPDEDRLPVRPDKPIYGGTRFILSQIALPHVSAVDQLGLHRAWDGAPFSRPGHQLARLLHVELGRLWKQDAIRQAQNPSLALPPRLRQTLAELLAGAGEKQIAMKLGLSKHTVHNYVKALHERFGVSSRGELLARANAAASASNFTPKLSVEAGGTPPDHA